MSEITSESPICDLCLAPDSFGLIKRETYDRKYESNLPVKSHGVCIFRLYKSKLLVSAQHGCYFCGLLHQLSQHPCSGKRKSTPFLVRICTDPALSVYFLWDSRDPADSIVQIYRPLGLSYQSFQIA
jgi:hypothetical protein